MARVKKAPAAKPVAKASLAKNNPVISKKIIASEELPVAPEATVHFSQEGRKEEVSDIVVESNVYGLNEKAAKLAFLEEPVLINISEGTEKDAEKYVHLSVNGQGAGPGGTPWVPRGIDVTIKRKFVSVLCNARPVRYHNYEEVAPNGERVSKQRSTSADRYPFQVVEDSNPKGREWLSNLRASRRAG
jgi:hypothetical protein